MWSSATERMRWLLAAALAGNPACDADQASPSASRPHGASSTEPSPWTERLLASDVDAVRAALGQSHEVLRAGIGPHRLHAVADYSLTPTTDRPSTPPPVDAQPVRAQQIHDELTLDWAPTDDDHLRFRLSQANDHERGREVIVIDQRVYVRKAHRTWEHYSRDSDLVDQWLNDAQHSVADLVELATPRLVVHARALEAAGLGGGPAVEITLTRSDTIVRDAVAGPTQGWRHDAEIHAIAGTLVLDANSGAWLRAEIDVRYRLVGAEKQPLEGHVHLHAEVTPAAVAAVLAPDESTPLPRRLRYDEQERQLLDGLAAH